MSSSVSAAWSSANRCWSLSANGFPNAARIAFSELQTFCIFLEEKCISIYTATSIILFTYTVNTNIPTSSRNHHAIKPH